MKQKKGIIITIVTLIILLILVISIYFIRNSMNKKFIISFDTKGGTYISNIRVKKGNKVPKPIDPQKEEYYFINWEYNGKVFNFNTEVENNMELVANWGKKEINSITYTVSFDTDNGSTIPNMLIKKGEKLNQPENPTKEGYEFVNWILDDKEFDFNTNIDKDIVLKAVWKEIEKPNENSNKKTYTVKFNTNGGNSISDYSVKEGYTVKKPYNPRKKGYTFNGWTLNGKLFNFNTKIYKNITLLANWKKIEEPIVNPTPKMYTVTFNTNGGTNINSVKVKEGTTVSKPSNPTKNDYVFIGWTLNGRTYDFNSKINGDITLIANWKKVDKPIVNPTPKMYTVTFNTNGGTSINSVKVKEGTTVSKPSNPTKSGYTFTGWTLNGRTYDFNSKVTGDITLVANWKKVEQKTYTVKVTPVDDYSPDRVLTVYENGKKINVQSIKSNGVQLCKGNNLVVNKFEIQGLKTVTLVLMDGSSVNANIL